MGSSNGLHTGSRTFASTNLGGTPACRQPMSSFEGGHQLEKLEFALAVAITRGDVHRSEQLRAQIAALGGNREEPGT
jgi:hypothetical protein